MQRALPEHCCLLKSHGKCRRLVRRNLREEFFNLLRKQNHVFAPAHPICREALAGKVNAARILEVCP